MSSARSTVARWPSWSVSSVTSTLAEEAVQDAFTAACSGGRPPGCRRARRDGSSRPPATARSTGSAGRRRARTGTPRPLCYTRRDEPAEEDVVRDDRLRLIFTCCHPALASRRPGRADAAAPRRAHDRGNRARLPGARNDDGAAAGPSQGQDPRREDPVPGSRARPTSRAAFARCWRSSTSFSTRATRRARASGWSARICARRPSASDGCSPSSCPTNRRSWGCSR